MLYRATLWMMDKTVGSQQDDHMFPFLCCFSRSKVQKHVLSLTKNACRYECERMVCLCVPWWTGDLSRAYFLSSSYSMRPMKPLSMCSLSKVFWGFKHKSQGISTWSIKVFCINGLDQWHWCFNTVLGHIMHQWQTVILSTFTKHGSFLGGINWGEEKEQNDVVKGATLSQWNLMEICIHGVKYDLYSCSVFVCINFSCL